MTKKRRRRRRKKKPAEQKGLNFVQKLDAKLKDITLSVYVGFSITVLIVYTIVTQILTVVIKQFDSSTLTTCVFAFFGGEVVSCALIKIFKLHGEKKDLDEGTLYIPDPDETATDEAEGGNYNGSAT